MMKIKILNNANELHMVTPCEVNYLLWGTTSIPRTYAYLGFVPEDGFYLRMICEETNPRRTYTQSNEPVYRDSAMEAFFQFSPAQGSAPVYLNFEFNANGALLATYGPKRTYRSYFTEEEYAAFDCKAAITENNWMVELKIPLAVLEQIYGSLSLKKGSTFSCNFYKISEDAEIEHYASYSPILTDTPSFHLPEFFAAATLE